MNIKKSILIRVRLAFLAVVIFAISVAAKVGHIQFVEGEKWIRINRGEEFLQLRGIVRPVDISTGNSVLSTQIADAELGYGGTGQVASASRQGWLSRFFGSVLWPL